MNFCSYQVLPRWSSRRYLCPPDVAVRSYTLPYKMADGCLMQINAETQAR